MAGRAGQAACAALAVRRRGGVLMHAVRALASARSVDLVVVAAPEDSVDAVASMLSEHAFPADVVVVTGTVVVVDVVDVDVVDAVVDACDQVKAKTAMAAWAIQQKVCFITVGAAGGKRQAHKVDVDDLSNTSHDPLLAKLRYNLRREHGAARDGKKIGVACVFSREAVAQPDASCDVQGDGTLNCSGYGSVVSVTATFGQCAAGWVFEQISSRPLPKH